MSSRSYGRGGPQRPPGSRASCPWMVAEQPHADTQRGVRGGRGGCGPRARRGPSARRGRRRTRTSLGPQPGHEAHPGGLLVEVAVEVQQVGLEQRGVGVARRRWAAARATGRPGGHRRRGAGTSRRRCRRPGGRSRRARPRWRWGTPASRPRSSPGSTTPAHLVGPAEHGVGLVERRRRPAAGGWRWTTPGRGRPRRGGRPRRPGRGPPPRSPARAPMLPQQRHVAPAAVAEVEVVAHHHGPCPQRADQHLVDEVLGGLLGARASSKWTTTTVCRRRCRQQLELLVQVGEQPRRRSRGAPRMAGWRSKVTTALGRPRSAASSRTGR